LIRFQIPRGVWSVSVRIFDARGRAIRTLATCAPSTGDGEFVWDGRDGERTKARIGIYIVYVEATDAGRLSSFTAKGVVVLARRLF
jgi:flagellar hook assembly protein FlgD